MTQLQRVLLLRDISELLNGIDREVLFTEEEVGTIVSISERELSAAGENDEEISESLRKMAHEIYADLIKAEAFL